MCEHIWTQPEKHLQENLHLECRVYCLCCYDIQLCDSHLHDKKFHKSWEVAAHAGQWYYHLLRLPVWWTPLFKPEDVSAHAEGRITISAPLDGHSVLLISFVFSLKWTSACIITSIKIICQFEVPPQHPDSQSKPYLQIMICGASWIHSPPPYISHLLIPQKQSIFESWHLGLQPPLHMQAKKTRF